jgi:ubiquinone/menaquinone biosynthesis C-methylase UbiE
VNPGHRGYDSEVRRHDQVLHRILGVGAQDHILDIGCGIGQTARRLARLATAGTVLGIDISASAIERARELTRAEGLGNVTFEHADAQVHRFPPECFVRAGGAAR